MPDQPLSSIPSLAITTPAQALRLIRDTCPGVASRIADRCLRENGITDPPDVSEADIDGAAALARAHWGTDA